MYCLQTDNILLLYSRCFTSLQKNRRPRTDPWGTPLFKKAGGIVLLKKLQLSSGKEVNQKLTVSATPIAKYITADSIARKAIHGWQFKLRQQKGGGH